MNTYYDNFRSTVIKLIDKEQSNITEYSNLLAKNTTPNSKVENEIDTLFRLQSILKRISSILEVSLSKSRSNSTTSTSNIEIAVNYILELASGVGTIYSIINAADYGKEIFENASYLKSLMEKTAVLAEEISSDSTTFSKIESELNYSQLSAQLDQVIKDIQTNINTSEQRSSKENLQATKLSEDQKAVETKIILGTKLSASNLAFNLINIDLNLNLKVRIESIKSTTEVQPNPSTLLLNVSFNQLLHPFHSTLASEKSNIVKNYFGFIVKDNNKSNFTISMAESLLIKNPTNVQVLNFEDKTQNNRIVSVNLKINDLLDSDGDKIDLDSTYVFFIFAELTNHYKKECNNFEDFLSAPSLAFKGKHFNETLISKNVLQNDIFPNREFADKNLNLLLRNTVSSLALNNQFKITLNRVLHANNSINSLTRQLSTLSKKLIYTADCLNKATNIIIRKKAKNPLISDELIDVVNSAGTNANQAIASTLVALEDIYHSQSSLILLKETMTLIDTVLDDAPA